jgi:hypothetical protein
MWNWTSKSMGSPTRNHLAIDLAGIQRSPTHTYANPWPPAWHRNRCWKRVDSFKSINGLTWLRNILKLPQNIREWFPWSDSANLAEMLWIIMLPERTFFGHLEKMGDSWNSNKKTNHQLWLSLWLSHLSLWLSHDDPIFPWWSSGKLT